MTRAIFISSLAFALGVNLAPASQAAFIVGDSILQTAGSAQNPPAVLIADAADTSYVSPVGAPAANVWHTSAGETTSTFEITLDQNYDLTNFYLWNYNHSTAFTLGVKDFTLSVSSGLVGSFTQVGGTKTATIAAGNSTVESFGFAATNVRRVQFDILTNGGFSGIVGAGELAFEGAPTPPPTIPEPSTFVLAALSVIGLAFGRRRRRRV